MKLTEIRDAVTKELSDYVGDFVFYLYQHGSLIFKIRGLSSTRVLVMIDFMMN